MYFTANNISISFIFFFELFQLSNCLFFSCNAFLIGRMSTEQILVSRVDI